MTPFDYDSPLHPDGDPFAAQDAAAASNSRLGRMEAQAREEEQREAARANGNPGPSPSSATGRGQRTSTSVYASGSPKRPRPRIPDSALLVLVDSSDEEDASPPPKPKKIAPLENATATEHGTTSRQYGATGDAPSSPANSAPMFPRSTSASIQQQLVQVAAVSSSRDSSPSSLSSSPNSPAPAHAASGTTTKMAPSSSVGGDPSTTDAIDANGPALATTKQRRSPTPPAPKPKLPPRTVRLEITLPNDVSDVPEYSIAELARDAGFNNDEDEEGERASDGSNSGSDDSASEEADAGEKKKGKGKQKAEAGATEDVSGGDRMEGVEGTAGEPQADGAAEPPKKRRKREPNKVLGRFGGYDTDDSFVDDSEIGFYEPKYYHRPKREGFYVCTGVLEVVTDKPGRGRAIGSKNKPKYDKDGNLIVPTRKPKGMAAAATIDASDPAALTSKTKSTIPSAAPKGARKSLITGQPMAVEIQAPLPMVSSIPAFGNGSIASIATSIPKPKKKKGVHSPELQAEFDALRIEVAKEDFSAKSKFPPRLRPLIVQTALRALELGEYDDDFFAELPKIFPYNNFTMKKLTKREVFPKRIELMNEEQELHFQALRDGIAELLPKQQREFAALHLQWEQEQVERDEAAEEKRKRMVDESLRQDEEAASPPPQIAAVAPHVSKDGSTPVGGEDVTMDSPAPAGDGADSNAEPSEPKWKFRFTEAMRHALYHAYKIEDDKTELIIEKQTLEKATEKEGPAREKPYSQLGARKAVYAKICAMWPADTMTTNQLSREMSLTKKKIEKNAAADA